MGSIKVVVADDDALMRHTLTSMLHTDPRFDVVGHAANGPDLLEVTALSRPHVALVDVQMPGGGPELVRALADGPPVVAVVVSAETSPTTVLAMLRAGARGYLTKGRLGASLPDLVARCAHGEVVIGTPTGAEALRQLLSVRVR
jgi:DNA-binding NarL/FixJ family response regulator